MSRLPSFPVLLYHGVTRAGEEAPCAPRERKYWLEAHRLRTQLRLLRLTAHRFAPLTETWGASRLAARGHRPIVLTFDDGRASDYEAAFPVLVETGARAEFFVNTATVGTPGFLSWAQIAEMQQAGMAFQSHAHEHVDLRQLGPQALAEQLGGSRRRLEDRLGAAVEFLAAPYGRTSPRVIAAALKQGYRAVCTSRTLHGKQNR